jgi:threonine/homoserine/homoserine lactone efflux protein
MTLQHFIAYFLVLFVATITPGPSMLLAVNHGANHGIGKSMVSAIGNVLGNLLMALISILGLGAVLLASGYIFNFIKWAGSLYLTFIGIRLLFEPTNSDQAPAAKEKKLPDAKTGRRLFIDGFFIAIGNPKGILFFTALFPQFFNTKSATLACSAIIFATLGAVAFGCYMLYAAFGSRLSQLFHLRSFRKLFNRITGSIFIGAGAALAFTKK